MPLWALLTLYHKTAKKGKVDPKSLFAVSFALLQIYDSALAQLSEALPPPSRPEGTRMPRLQKAFADPVYSLVEGALA